MNSQEITGGDSEQLIDGITHLRQRGDDTIEYIFT